MSEKEKQLNLVRTFQWYGELFSIGLFRSHEI